MKARMSHREEALPISRSKTIIVLICNVENMRNYSFIFIDVKFVLDTFVLTVLKYIIQIDAFSLRCDKKDAGSWKNIRYKFSSALRKLSGAPLA